MTDPNTVLFSLPTVQSLLADAIAVAMTVIESEEDIPKARLQEHCRTCSAHLRELLIERMKAAKVETRPLIMLPEDHDPNLS